MYVVVKKVDSSGALKGRGYTYESDLDLSIGDKVIAEFGKSDTVLEVVEVLEGEQNFEFEVKKIKTLFTGEADSDGVLPDETIDIKIEEEVLPVIKINFESLKNELTDMLTKYKNVVVTEQSLSGCKATQKQLAGLRIKIDNYRKEKKKELSIPIAIFEEQCKELIALVEKAENPIKEGIAVFDDAKRSEKLEQAKEIMKTVAEKLGLNEKYAAKMEIQNTYSNLTITKADIENDVTARALALLAEQNKEKEMLDIITDTIEFENKRLKTKIQLVDFEKYIEKMTTSEVIREIRKFANTIYEAENIPEEEVEEEVVEEIYPESIEMVEADEPTISQIPDCKYFGVYRIEGNLSELKLLSAYLKEHKISYTVEDEGEL